MLEKYKRNFDAASIVYQEGLKQVSQKADETALLKKYLEFA